MKRKIQLLVLAAAMSLNFSVPVLAEDIEGIQSEETFEAGFESRSVIIEMNLLKTDLLRMKPSEMSLPMRTAWTMVRRMNQLMGK